MQKRYKSSVLAAIHETAADFYSIGIMDEKTMHHFDEFCLPPMKFLTPRQIAAIRKREVASQSVVAYYLGVSASLVSQWERGEKKPSGPSLKLLTLVKNKGLDYVA